jgi:CelD/BcsL family acetyltransferase involved in cellulose biosynthesis
VLPGICGELSRERLPAQFLEQVRSLPAYRVDLARVRAGGGVAAILSANGRQQLNRSRRDLAQLGSPELEAAATTEEALNFFDGLERLHVRSWIRRKRHHAFASPFFGRFHRTLIQNHFASGGIELMRLRAGDHAFGFLYNFRRNGCVYAYQSGFDDSDPRLRPGYVAHALAIDTHAASGDAVYDFMAGRNRLKERFATDPYEMHWYKIQRPLLRFRAERAARAIKDLF